MKRESAPDDTPSSLSSKSRNHLEELSDIESEDDVTGFTPVTLGEFQQANVAKHSNADMIDGEDKRNDKDGQQDETFERMIPVQLSNDNKIANTAIKSMIKELEDVPGGLNPGYSLLSPQKVINHMLKMIEAKYSHRYRSLLQNYEGARIEDDLQSLLLPKAFHIFESRNYSREK